MFIDVNSIQVNNVSFGQYLLEAKYKNSQKLYIILTNNKISKI